MPNVLHNQSNSSTQHGACIALYEAISVQRDQFLATSLALCCSRLHYIVIQGQCMASGPTMSISVSWTDAESVRPIVQAAGSGEVG